jgi:AraC-like DNA-binding protein
VKLHDALFVHHLVEDHRIAWHGRYHSHQPPFYEVHFFARGSGTFLNGAVRHPIRPGQLFLTAPHEFHSIIPDLRGKPISYYAILFDATDNDYIATELLNVQTAPLHGIPVDKTFSFYFDDLVRLFRGTDETLLKSGESLMESLVLRYCAHCKNETRQPAEKPAGAPKRSVHVEKALLMMQNMVWDNIRIEDIAANLGLSAEYFVRIFHNEVKMPPRQYFLRLKIEGASGMLISTTHTIAQIAEKFGFENQFHFSRVFKQCTGLAPLHYRQAYIQLADCASTQIAF